MKSTHLNGRRSSIIEICDNAAYPSFSFEASCPKERDFRRKNRKRAYRDADTGLHPFVKLIEAPGTVYTAAEHFISEVRAGVEAERQVREHQRRVLQPYPTAHSTELKSIESFRADPKYGGDGTRIDLAYAIYAASHGAGPAQIEAAIRSRDLSHKGGERRQADYVERTIQKAIESARTQSRGR